MGLNARKPVFGGFLNNKGADQPYPCNLISAFVIYFLEIIISRLAMREIFSVAKQAGMNLTLSETPKTDFLALPPIYHIVWS